MWTVPGRPLPARLSAEPGSGRGEDGQTGVTIITLVKPEQRAASVALGRVAGNFGLGSGATVAGFVIASAQQLSSFQTLYLFDALTYAGFALVVLAAVPNPRAETVTATDAGGTGFRAVARDRLFLTVIAANIVLVVVGHTFFSNILPPFAKTHTSLGPGAIGILVLVNTAFVVIAQIPSVRVVARMRRTHAFATASALFALSLLAVLPATLIHSEIAATSLLAGVAIVFAIGECAHIVVLGPLVADMAPAHLLGRYLSLYSLTFSVSLALGPAIGGLLLQTSPDAIWWGGALAAALAGAALLRLGGRIPDPLHEAPSRLASTPEAARGPAERTHGGLRRMSRPPRGRHRAAPSCLRSQPSVCDLRAPCSDLNIRPQPLHGCEPDHDRPALRPPDERWRRSRPPAARRQRRRPEAAVDAGGRSVDVQPSRAESSASNTASATL